MVAVAGIGWPVEAANVDCRLALPPPLEDFFFFFFAVCAVRVSKQVPYL